MARTINKVQLLGRVGIDPEMRYTLDGTAVTNLRLATDRYRKNGEDETDWHDVVVWGPTAEAVNEYVGKGQRRHRTEVHASEVVFLDSRNGNGNGGDGQADDASPL